MDKLPKKSLDVQSILEKIKNLPIDDKDKATILEEIKKNIMNPSAGENKNLDDIQAKYTGEYQLYSAPPSFMSQNYPQKPQPFPLLHQPQAFQSIQQQQEYPLMHQGIQKQGYNMQQPYSDQQQPMTSAQFEILKNKIDSLQYELIDLLRHVKDYTQRYMNAIRQQDLDKINEYINGLFEVDKTLKETQDLAKSAPPDEEEAEPEDRKSIIAKATSGIKNFFGNIGNNVSGITDLVKNTADIANGYLTKKVIPTSNVSINTNQNTINNSGTSGSKNKNIVSVDDYISDMNKMEELNNNASTNIKTNIPIISNANVISSNSNNINSLGEIQSKGQMQPKEPMQSNESNESKEPMQSNESNESNETETEKDLEGAIKKLNDTMNADIDKTTEQLQTGGNRTLKNNKTDKHFNKKEYNLQNKIKLLKLKLTKNKLQKELKKNKTIIVKKKKIITNKNNKK
jgi:hypothetical protein